LLMQDHLCFCCCSTEPVFKQQKLNDVFVHRQKCGKEKSQIINGLVLNVIIKGQRPLSLVEDEAFRELLAYVEPGYILPGRKHFTGAVQAKYTEVREKLSCVLSDVEHISITADTWTSIAVQSYLTVTVHYVSKEWTLKSHVLGTLLLEERHTGEHLSEWIVEMLANFSISPSKVVAVVHDNASNMLSAMNILMSTYTSIQSVRCSAHTLQLVVHSTLRENTAAQSALASARKIVEHFRRSSVANGALTQQQEQMNLKSLDLIQDVPTRWSSTFNMCKRILELRLPLSMVLTNQAIIDKQKRQQLELRSEEWTVLETMCELLEPFAALTKYLEAETYLSISAVQPLVRGIIEALNVKADDRDYAKSFKDTAVKALLERFDNMFNPLPSDPSAVPVALRASALDVRFHKLKSLAGSKAKVIRASIESELVANGNGGENVAASAAVAHEGTQSSAGEVSATTVVGSLLSYLSEHNHSDDEDDMTEENAFTSRSVRRQMATFVSQNQQPHDVDSLQWWKANEARFKALARAARKYLGIPATSAPSERVFSLAGSICNRRRACLSPDTLDALVFLNANAELL